ncbi:glutamate ABC transporter substrate-binding protein [Streptomyces sp. ST2-7A]|uniref:glutamate ABC transporter substrate-binding protein n=1 Tax=Streptomyces sp. ST2-7A TaxID=2907214 RepID=UPI001F2C5532|nr:glutamate ABC transporter substrate-binding protein [Streptomyces sp. ST2-7A]MCE7079254.1 glutamate ABC transporter substrate-binding protein [Streptomyces sp. ST2-7A]
MTESPRPSDASGPAVRRIVSRGALVVGVDQNSYLWGFRTPDTGRFIGFDIDLVEAVAEELLGPRARVVYRAVPTSERIRLIREREVDMVVRTMSITCERRGELAFSAAYFEAGQQLVVPRRSGITGLNGSLTGRRVCSAADSTAEALLLEVGVVSRGVELITTANHLDCVVLLQLGEAEALLTDSALAAGHLAQDPTLRLVGVPLTSESYGVAMHPDDEDLVRRVNRALETFTAGGEESAWHASYRRWLAEHLEDPDPRPPVPVYRE